MLQRLDADQYINHIFISFLLHDSRFYEYVIVFLSLKPYKSWAIYWRRARQRKWDCFYWWERKHKKWNILTRIARASQVFTSLSASFASLFAGQWSEDAFEGMKHHLAGTVRNCLILFEFCSVHDSLSLLPAPLAPLAPYGPTTMIYTIKCWFNPSCWRL